MNKTENIEKIKEFRQKMIRGFIIIAGSSLVFGGGSFYLLSKEVKHDIKYKKLYEQVLTKADIDGKYGTTSQEWGKVYDSLYLQYDALNPTPLTTEQMEEYLGKN